MARSVEAGIGYFPLNTDIVLNSKVRLVVAEFGPKAWAVLLPLYCKIYREKGYWLDWCDEDAKLLFAKDECHLEVNFVNEVVAGCIRRGLFDKSVFETFGVLTSDRIQENYFEAKKRAKNVVVFEQFLVSAATIPENVCINAINVNILTKKVSIGTQIRIDKNKEDKNTHSSDQLSAYNKLEKTGKNIYNFIKNETPKFPDPYKDAWNLFATQHSKPQIKVLTDFRKKKLMVRLQEMHFNFLDILDKARRSDFLMSNQFFSFDWIVENGENYLKVIEGKYDNQKKEAQTANTISHTDAKTILDAEATAKQKIEAKYGPQQPTAAG